MRSGDLLEDASALADGPTADHNHVSLLPTPAPVKSLSFWEVRHFDGKSPNTTRAKWFFTERGWLLLPSCYFWTMAVHNRIARTRIAVW